MAEPNFARKRKIPGPISHLDTNQGVLESSKLHKVDGDSSLQSEDNHWNSNAWREAWSVLGFDPVTTFSSSKGESSCGKLQTLKELKENHWGFERAKTILVIVESVQHSTDMSAVIRLSDPTGKGNGYLHSKIIVDHGSELTIGSVLLIRNAALIHNRSEIGSWYLNITPDNLLMLWPMNVSSSNYGGRERMKGLEMNGVVRGGDTFSQPSQSRSQPQSQSQQESTSQSKSQSRPQSQSQSQPPQQSQSQPRPQLASHSNGVTNTKEAVELQSTSLDRTVSSPLKTCTGESHLPIGNAQGCTEDDWLWDQLSDQSTTAIERSVCSDVATSKLSMASAPAADDRQMLTAPVWALPSDPNQDDLLGLLDD